MQKSARLFVGSSENYQKVDNVLRANIFRNKGNTCYSADVFCRSTVNSSSPKNVKYKVLKMFALKREKKFGLAESCTNTAHGSNCPIYPYLCPGGTAWLFLEGKYKF